MIYKVYVLYSPGFDRLFAGMTTSLIDRIESHNAKLKGEWATEYGPWTLIHLELYPNESDAFLRLNFLESDPGQQFVRRDVLPLFNF